MRGRRANSLMHRAIHELPKRRVVVLQVSDGKRQQRAAREYAVRAGIIVKTHVEGNTLQLEYLGRGEKKRMDTSFEGLDRERARVVREILLGLGK